MSVGNVQHEIDQSNRTVLPNGARRYIKRVLLAANEALVEGQGVCYRRTFGVETEADESRDWRVALPSISNHLAFAGVATQAYSSSTTEQWVLIYEPPSICKVFYATDGTLVEDRVKTCAIDTAFGSNTGKFFTPGFSGRGAVRFLQNATGSLILAELLDGEESGLVDYHSLEANGSGSGGARTTTKYGHTVFEGTAAPGSDITMTLADGLWVGQRKMYRMRGTLANNDVVVTVTTGKQMDGTTTLATITMRTDMKFALLEWNGFHWKLLAHDTTLA